MGALFTLAIVLYTIVCVLLILLVIIQGGKAEGLFANSQSNVLGSQSATVLTKATRLLSTIFIVGALVISIAISSQKTAFDNIDVSTQTVPATTVTPPVPTPETATIPATLIEPAMTNMTITNTNTATTN